MFWKVSQNPQKSTDEFCEIFKNTFFTEHLWTTASEIWYYSYSYTPLISFHIFITTCLYLVEFYQQISQSNKFNRNDFKVLINYGWSALISKLSLRSLNLFVSEARISKWSKSIEQLRWGLGTANCLALARRFPV